MKKCFLLLLACLLITLCASAMALTADSYEDISKVYTFTLDNVEYSLPCPISRFIENGWKVTVKSNDFDLSSTLDGRSYNDQLSLSKDDCRMRIKILNVLEEARPVSELTVAGLTFYREGSENSNHGLKPGMLIFANGLKLGMPVSEALACCSGVITPSEKGDGYYTIRFGGEKSGTLLDFTPANEGHWAKSFSFDYSVPQNGPRQIGKLPVGDNNFAVFFTDHLLSEDAVVDTIQIRYLYPTADELAAVQ